ncbi:MAG: BREX system P-loop protein BrxC [Candidatus Brocadiia bacterium]
MTEKLNRDLFARDIDRRIEEVIKVDQTDEKIIHDEIEEYVVTDAIGEYYVDILNRYQETPNNPHEGVGVWVSGFFGSGKSSFAKMLGLALQNQEVMGVPAAELFSQHIDNERMKVHLSNITENIPTHSVIFDVSSERGIRSGNQTIYEIMYRMFLESLGYARDLDLAELEISLEEAGRLNEFKETYADIYDKSWDREKGKVAFAIGEASRVMHEMDPETYETADSWSTGAQDRADITADKLATRCQKLMERRKPDHTLMFVIDEVGQFVSRNVQKMLDLQGVIQSLGRVGRGKMWLVVTSQEKLTELVDGLDDKRVELARLMDRFPQELQVHLEPSDISEVTSKRVLSKNAEAEELLRDVYSRHRGRLSKNTQLSADIRLPELNADSFIDLYPLMPYQVDLMISVVSGLRTQGGASKHVGGANRTIIKLAQQLLIHPDVNLADEEVGTLTRIDQMYDLVSGNIPSEIRGKIDRIEEQADHEMAQPVAKAICLLQYVKSIHRTEDNIAAALHPAVDADSVLPKVKEALAELEDRTLIRHDDEGYRIPTPAEDDWDKQRDAVDPTHGDMVRLYREALEQLWQPQPSHNFMKTKKFTAGLYFNGRPIKEGDIPFDMTLAEVGEEYDQQVSDMRSRSQTEDDKVFWITPVGDAIRRETVELYRSKKIIQKKERGSHTEEERDLITEEKSRQSRHQKELKRLLKRACLGGTLYFRGNDRSPSGGKDDVGKVAEGVLKEALPDVYDRFEEAAAKVKKKDLKALLTADNLKGLPSVFTDLGLLRDENGRVVFSTDEDPLNEVFNTIKNRTDYGETASGRYLANQFADEPFGWDFDVVRLLVISLLRAGQVEAVSKGKTIDSALSVEAQNTFPNNNRFRSASFRPKVSDIDFPDVVDAADAFEEIFGQEVAELEQTAVVRDIQEQLARKEDQIREAQRLLTSHSLPGAEVLDEAIDQISSIRTGDESNAILTFNGAYRELEAAIQRTTEIHKNLTEPRLQELKRARDVLDNKWPVLKKEEDLDETYREHAEKLQDLMQRESFFDDLAAIDRHANALKEEYDRRHQQALEDRTEAYEEALEELHGMPEWTKLEEEKRERVASRIKERATDYNAEGESLALLRTERDACERELAQARENAMRLIDGKRVERVSVGSYFQGGIETEEQLDEALKGLREKCEKLIGAGKKILLQ